MEETTTPIIDTVEIDEDDSETGVSVLIVAAGTAAVLLAVGSAAYYVKKKNTQRKEKFAAKIIESFLESNPHLAEAYTKE